MRMDRPFVVDSPLGRCEVDRGGEPVGVARMNPEKSYVGVPELLQQYINASDRQAWQDITAKIDYTFENLDFALASLENEAGFGRRIQAELKKGRKLLFKPNLVNVHCIDSETHGPGMGATACTEWAFVAALMRWFNDKLGIPYHEMALGEAATVIPAAAVEYSRLHPKGKTVTPEAVIEGKAGDFYGGWGFYFVRKYLSEKLSPNAPDDPMKGYEESLAGTYIPMGKVRDKLMVYDLNRIFDDPDKGRELVVPDGVNFRTLTLHKAVAGGDPAVPEDLEYNPGCILINVPKLKVHAMTLLTNVIKNLGIGLYPMQHAPAGSSGWEYAVPRNGVPGLKGGIPHQVWDAEMDPETLLPKKGVDGMPVIRRTGGLTATMIDIIQAVRSQGILMLHVVDGIEAVNVDHQGIGMGRKEKEGMVFAGMDPVATDLLCARYLFSNVPINEAVEAGMEDGHGGRFPQRVPVPGVEGGHIANRMGYDSPLSRDRVFETAEKRGLGRRTYHVTGHDAVSGGPLVSIQGHLGFVREGKFSDLITNVLYFDAFCMPWCLQKTCYGYMESVDLLTGSSLKESFLNAFDEDGDGVVTYEEFGKKGQNGMLLHWGGDYVSKAANDPLGYLKGRFSLYSRMIKHSRPEMNRHADDSLLETGYGPVCLTAFHMSTMPESPDFFVPNLTWGKGKWPSFDFARFVYLASTLYGPGFPNRISPSGLYGLALFYADLTQGDGRYAGRIRSMPDPESVSRYLEDASGGAVRPFKFTLFVPPGLDNVGGAAVPNVQVTNDPDKVFTAIFPDSRETWPQ